ncbi:MAG: hypothetical protein ACOVOV_05000, partial [Dolichospermum sp.]
GGTSITTGYAASATGFLPWAAKPISGISVFNSTLDAQGGNIVVRGALNSQIGNVSGRAVILTSSTVKTTSAGTVSVDGTAGNFAGTNPWGVVIETSSVVETASGSINLTGTGSIAKTNARGFAIVGGSSIQSATGAIAIVDNTDGTSSNYTGTYIANSSKFGKSALASSSSNITISADKIQFDASANNFTTSGNVIFEPYLNTFRNEFITSGLVFGNQVQGLTIGKSTNTANITLSSAVSIAGPITAYGGNIAVNSNLSSTLSTGIGISLNGTKITQNTNINVVTGGSHIDYVVTNAPFTAGADDGIGIGQNALVDAAGGNISLNASYASTGVAGTNSSLYDNLIRFSQDSRIVTNGSGTITIIGDGTNNTATGNAVWTISLLANNCRIQTASGAIT